MTREEYIATYQELSKRYKELISNIDLDLLISEKANFQKVSMEPDFEGGKDCATGTTWAMRSGGRVLRLWLLMARLFPVATVEPAMHQNIHGRWPLPQRNACRSCYPLQRQIQLLR